MIKKKLLGILLLSCSLMTNLIPILYFNQNYFNDISFLNYYLINKTINSKYPNNVSLTPENQTNFNLNSAGGKEFNVSGSWNLIIQNFTDFHESSQNVSYGNEYIRFTEEFNVICNEQINNTNNDGYWVMSGGTRNFYNTSNRNFIGLVSANIFMTFLRFQIKRYVKVTSAYVTFTGYDGSGNPFNAGIRGLSQNYSEGDLPDFTTNPSYMNTINEGETFYIPSPIYEGTEYTTRSMVNTLQAIIDPPSFKDGFHVGFRFHGGSGYELASFWDCSGNSSKAAEFYAEGVRINVSNAYYISKNIPLSGKNLIEDVTYNSYKEENANISIQYYDFNTETWKNKAEYIGTQQDKFKFKVLLNNTGDRNLNATLYNLTLKLYSNNSYKSTISRPVYFNQPQDIAVDDKGFIYVADKLNNRIKKFDSNGNFILEWGTEGSSKGQFNQPCALDISAEWDDELNDFKNYIYVIDYYNNRIQKFDENGTFILEWGSYGGPDEGGKFKLPIGIAIYSPRMPSFSPIIYIADSGNKQIQKFWDNGFFIDKWEVGELSYNFKISMNRTEYIYIADIERDTIYCYDKLGNLEYKWGESGDGEGEFSKPSDIAFDSEGYVHVLDSYNNRIQKFTSTGEYMDGSTWGNLGTEDGEFNFPLGLFIDNANNFYVVDTYNYRIQKFDSSKSFIWKVGTVIPELKIIEPSYITQWGIYNGTNLNNPRGIAVDSAGNQYVCDSQNNLIIKFDKWGYFLQKWGNGTPSDEYIFNDPRGIAVDNDGYIYVADSGNMRVVIFSEDEYIINFSKWDFQTGEHLGYLEDLEIYRDTENRTYLYVVDKDNQSVVKFEIFKEEPIEIGFCYILESYEIDNQIYEFKDPYGISIDKKGNIYISDRIDKSILKFDNETNLLLKVGGAESDIFDNISGLISDSKNNLYIINTNQTTNNHSLMITTNSFCFIAEIKINNAYPYDVCIDEDDNILVLTNNSILKYRYLEDFQPLLSTLEPNLPQVCMNASKPPVFDKDGNVYVLNENRIHKFDNYGNFIKTFDPEVQGYGVEIKIKNFNDGSSYLYQAIHNDYGPEYVVKYSLNGEKLAQNEISNHDNLSSIAIDDENSVYCLVDSGIVKYVEFGNYKALYSFENEALGRRIPSGWDGYYLFPNSSVEIVEEEDGHVQVVQLHTRYSYGGQIYQTISGPVSPIHENGTVEFYIRTNNTQEKTEMFYGLTNGSSPLNAINMYIVSGHFSICNYSQWINLTTLDVNTWYHIKISFFNASIAHAPFYIYINSTRYPSTGFFTAIPGSLGMERIYFSAMSNCASPTPYYTSIDAVDYSWDPGYYEGRNLNLDSDFYNGNGEISSEGGKNQIEIDSLGNLYYLSHSTNEILKINWESQNILERWRVDASLSEHQFCMDKKDTIYLLNKWAGQGNILKISNESEFISKCEFNYNISEELSISTDYFTDLYLIKSSYGSNLMLYKFGHQELPPELTFQLTDTDNWRDIAINLTNIITLSSVGNIIKVYNSSGYFIKILNNSGLESPSHIDIDSNGNLIVLDSDNKIKILNESSLFHTIIYEPTLDIIDFYLYNKNKTFVIVKDQVGHYLIKSYIYNSTFSQLTSSVQISGLLKKPTSICVVTEEDNERIYISDYLDNKIKEIDNNGNIIKEWGKPGSLAGEFIGPYKIVNDSFDGLYVLDVGNSRVQRFDREGNFKSEWGNFQWFLASDIVESHIDLAINKSNTNEILILDSLRINIYKYNYGFGKAIKDEDRTFVRKKIIDSCAIYGMPEIYAIIYDPPGRNSYGYIEKDHSYTINTDFNLKANYKFDWETFTEFAGTGAGSDESIEWRATAGNRWSTTKTTEERITSSQSNDKKYIGPGHGDTFWGEIWTYYFYITEETTYDSKGNVLNVNRTITNWIQRTNKFIITMKEVPNVFNNSFAQSEFIAKDIAYDNYISDNENKYLTNPQGYLMFGDGTTYEKKESHEKSFASYYSRSFTVSSSIAIKLGLELTVSTGAGVGVFEITGFKDMSRSVWTTTLWGGWSLDWDAENESVDCMGFVFSDETSKEPVDRYQFDSYVDTMYQTLCFINDNISSFSSEPWEYNTRDNHVPSICESCFVDENNDTIESPYITANSTRIRVKAEDDESGIDRVVLFEANPDPEQNDIAIGIIWNKFSDGYYYFDWDTTNHTEGEVSIYALAFDKFENNYSSSQIQFEIDHTPPNYVSVLPFETPQLPGDLVCKTIAFDNDKIDHVVYYDGLPKFGVTLNPNNGYSDDSKNSWIFHWTTTEADIGYHDIYVVAYDRAGNSFQGGPAYIYIGDPDPPSKCKIIEPTDYDAKNDDFTIIVEVEDDLSGVQLVRIFDVDPYGNQRLIKKFTRDPFDPPLTGCQVKWKIDNVTEGLHQIKVKAWDDYNNSKTDTINIYIDKTKPNPFSISYGYHNNYTIDLWAIGANDVISGIAKIEYYEGNELIGVSNSPLQFHFYWLGPIGVHTIHARAYDKAGNFIDSINNETIVIDYSAWESKGFFPPINDTNLPLSLILALILGLVGLITAIVFVRKRKLHSKYISKNPKIRKITHKKLKKLSIPSKEKSENIELFYQNGGGI